MPGGEKAAAEEALRYKQRWLFTPATLLSAVDSEPGVSLIRTKDKGVHRYVCMLCCVGVCICMCIYAVIRSLFALIPREFRDGVLSPVLSSCHPPFFRVF